MASEFSRSTPFRAFRGAGPLLASALLAACPPAWAGRKSEVSKKELSRIERRLHEKKQELRRDEVKAARLKENLEADRRRLEKLRAEKGRLERRGREAVEERRSLQGGLDEVEAKLFRADRRSRAAAKALYASAAVATPYSAAGVWRRAMLERVLGRELERDAALRSRRDSIRSKAADAVHRASQALQKTRSAGERETKAKTNLLAKKSDFVLARKSLRKRRSEVSRLEASAKKLDLLVRKLMRRKPAAGKLGRHSLPWPVRGELVSRFGKQRLEPLGTWVVHRGIRLATAPGAEVSPVGRGRIVYAGPFQSYGRVIIVDHGDGMMSVYGHLGTILKRTGQRVAPGDVLGTAGKGGGAVSRLVKAPQGRGSLYLEIRKGNKAVDPLRVLLKR